MDKQRRFILIAAVAGIISVFLPWTTISVGFMGYGASQSMNGFHGYGIVVFIAFIIAGITAIVGNQEQPLEKTTWLGNMSAGLAALLFTIIALANNTGSIGFVDAGAGFGIWIALAASIAVSTFGWLFRNRDYSITESLGNLKKSISVPSAPDTKTTIVTSSTQRIAELEKLIKLRNDGSITEEEYQQLKSKLL